MPAKEVVAYIPINFYSNRNICHSCLQWCKSLLSIGGDNLQFYPNFALFSTLGGMNLEEDFFQVSKLSEDQKKGLHQKWNTFFSPNSGEDQKKKIFTRN